MCKFTCDEADVRDDLKTDLIVVGYFRGEVGAVITMVGGLVTKYWLLGLGISACCVVGSFGETIRVREPCWGGLNVKGACVAGRAT